MSRTQALTDAQWALISPLMPSSDGKQGRPFRDHRQVVEGIIYRYRTGIAWRDVPAGVRSVADGVEAASAPGWGRHLGPVLAALLADADAAGLIDWEVSVDSTVTRAHQHGTNLTRAQQVIGGFGELQESGRGAA